MSIYVFLWFFQQLTNDFRKDYASFWTSILKSDVDGIKEYAGKLGIGELYGLFACMVAGRSWSSITQGIDKKKKGKSEVRT
jgi:aarF domain-containing kinase